MKTIKVADDVHQKLKLHCVKAGDSIYDFTNAAIKEKLNGYGYIAKSKLKSSNKK